MSDRRKIEDRLRKKEQEIDALEEQIKIARIYVQALQDVLKMLPKAPDPSITADAVLRPGSAVAQARDIILSRGGPVHISDLLQALGKDASRDSRSSLTSSLAAYVRRGEIFTRPAPNTFGLIELGDQPKDEEQTEPPASFGDIAAVPAAVSPQAAIPRPTAPQRPTRAEDDEDIPF